MATFPIIYKADGTNKVIIQYGKEAPTVGYMYTNFKVTEIKQSEDNTFIIKHIPIKTITKNAGTKTEETISKETISFLCLKDDSGTIVLDYCDDNGVITQPDDLPYGTYRTNPFYFEVDNVVFPSGDDGVTFEIFFDNFLINKSIKLEEKQLNFDFDEFFKKEQGGNGRKMRKRRQSRKKYASKKSKKYRRSRKRKGSRKKRN